MLVFYVDPEGKYEALEKYGNDLTELARRGKLDPVIGRDDEIRRCIQILSRRTKNNPVIIGEPGVGKTAIAEGYHLIIVAVISHSKKVSSLWKFYATCEGSILTTLVNNYLIKKSLMSARGDALHSHVAQNFPWFFMCSFNRSHLL